MIAIDLLVLLNAGITAARWAKCVAVMVAAVVAAVRVMVILTGAPARFIERHPTLKMLAPAVLVLIAALRAAEASPQHVDRGGVF